MLHGNWLSKSRQAGELLSRGEFERSIEIYSELARAFPRLPEVHNNLGVALRASGEINKAIKSYQRAVKLDPNSVNFLQSFLFDLNFQVKHIYNLFLIYSFINAL